MNYSTKELHQIRARISKAEGVNVPGRGSFDNPPPEIGNILGPSPPPLSLYCSRLFVAASDLESMTFQRRVTCASVERAAHGECYGATFAAVGRFFYSRRLY